MVTQSFSRREDTSLPEIPQQAWPAGLLPSPDAIALASEWEPSISVDPVYMPQVSSQQWNLLPPSKRVTWRTFRYQCRHQSYQGERRQSRGMGRGKGGVYTNAYTWLYRGNSNQTAWVWIQALPLVGCMTMGKSLDLSCWVTGRSMICLIAYITGLF